ncbi:hypothetical protein JCM16303_004109 [Sporobolomyces ruberrimus]
MSSFPHTPANTSSHSHGDSVFSPPAVPNYSYQVLQHLTASFRAQRTDPLHRRPEIIRDTIRALENIAPRAWIEMMDVIVEGTEGPRQVKWSRRIIGALRERVNNRKEIEDLLGNLHHFKRAFEVLIKRQSLDPKILKDFKDQVEAIPQAVDPEEFQPVNDLVSSLLSLKDSQVVQLFCSGDEKGGSLLEIQERLQKISEAIEDFNENHRELEADETTQLLATMEQRVIEIEKLCHSALGVGWAEVRTFR